jgi:hypothetical protein
MLALVALSCAPDRQVLLKSPGGRLRIANQAGEPVEVFARGTRVISRLDDGGDVLVDRLPLGDCQLEAKGERTGWRLGATLHLEEGGEVLWNVRGSDAHGEALRALPTGRVKFVNRSSEPIRAFVDDVPRELIWPGGEAEYSGIVPGPHHLSAVGTKTSFPSESDVKVSPGAVSLFEVSPPRAAMRVTNRSNATTWVFLKDGEQRKLTHGTSLTVDDLDSGSTKVYVRDEQGRLIWSGDVALIAGQTVDVAIPLPDGALSVLSYVATPLNIWVNGANLGLCAASGAAEFRGLPIGRSHIEAIDPDGRVLARAELVLQAGPPTLWMVREGDTSERRGDEGSLVVENGTAEPLRIQVDGVERGSILPGARRIVPGLVPGTRKVAAFGTLSKDVVRAEIDVVGGGVTSWTAGPRSAKLALRNDRTEEVRVLIDGNAKVRLAPSQSIELSIAAGASLIESVGVTSLRSTVHRMVLPAGDVSSLVFTAPFATVTATNRHQEPLMLTDGDRQLGVVLPNDRVVLRDIEPGDHRLEARSLDRPLSWHLKVTLSAGDSFLWDLGN